MLARAWIITFGSKLAVLELFARGVVMVSDNIISDAAKRLSEKGASRGGISRAAKLTAEERKNIARKAANARWDSDLPQATHYGDLKLGNLVIPCAVLADGTRILTQQGFLIAIGRSGKPAQGRGSRLEKTAPFLDLDNLKPYVDDELENSTKPISFRVPSGTRAYGYRAETLPRVCEVYLTARDDGALLKSQSKMAKACDILMRALAHVGIVALVDEATGYQEDRARDALAEILQKFISDELRRWVKTFPDEYFRELFRLKDVKIGQFSAKKPQYVGHWTNDIVYKRLAPGVLDELRKITPKTSKGNRKHKFHQRLSEDAGHPALREHLHAVVTLMKASDTWTDFQRLLDRSLPRQPQSAADRSQKRLNFDG